MNKVNDQSMLYLCQDVTLERITPMDGHYFFGYYDNPAWSRDGRYHLCHRVPFIDRLPRAGDIAVIGVIDRSDGSFEAIAETNAWNFQQGSMLQWHPMRLGEKIIYNVWDGGDYRGVVQHIGTGARRALSRPIANVDPTGRYAVSINFDRMYDFRPGYGYAMRSDPFGAELHPEQDGVFLIDLASGESRLVLSLARIWQETGAYFGGHDQKLLINHITFNTDGTRLVLLARNFAGEEQGWKTAILTVDPDGSDLFRLADYDYASHYHWRDPQHIVFHSGGRELGDAGRQLYVLKDRTAIGEAIDTGFFLRDGHCSYSPDRTLLLYDSYPDESHYRHLYLYHLSKRRGVRLGSFYSPPAIHGDIRCDLHPRWNYSGTSISFDSVHEGRRQVYVMDVSRVEWDG